MCALHRLRAQEYQEIQIHLMAKQNLQAGHVAFSEPLSTAPDQAKTNKTHWLTVDQLECAAARLGIAGALILAINVPFSSIGWVLMLGSSAFGLPWALRMGFRHMVVMQSVFMAINAIGVLRNLIPLL